MTTKSDSRPDMVNHPAHYKTASGLESIDVIEAFELSYCLGNTVKYILRHKKKGKPLEDLKKAKWYLAREIAYWEKAAQARASRPSRKQQAGWLIKKSLTKKTKRV